MQKCGSVSVFSIDTSSSRLINACFISSTEAGRGHPFWSNISTISILKQHFHSISILFPFYFHFRGLVLPFRRVLPFYSRTPLAHALGVDISLHVAVSTLGYVQIQKHSIWNKGEPLMPKERFYGAYYAIRGTSSTYNNLRRLTPGGFAVAGQGSFCGGRACTNSLALLFVLSPLSLNWTIMGDLAHANAFTSCVAYVGLWAFHGHHVTRCFVLFVRWMYARFIL